MFALPAAEPLLKAIAPAFTKPTLRRFCLLMTGIILTMGRRTVSRALRLVWSGLQGHFSSYHRLYSEARISMWQLSQGILRQMLRWLPSDSTIVLVVDDTTDGKEAEQVWGRTAHRDAVRSTRSRTQIKFGHKWLVMGLLLNITGAARPWALPLFSGLCRSPKFAKRWGGRQKTACQLTRQFLIRLMRWLPDRKFVLIGDYGVIGHETAAFAHRHRNRVMVVSRLRGDANLYLPPVKKGKVKGGGTARKGRKAPAPQQQAATLAVEQCCIAWYGCSRRRRSYVTSTGLWYNKHGGQVTPIRWVGVANDHGQFTDYFYCSEESIEARRIIEYYAMRWNIEVTFEEARAWLGVESTRHWCRQSVLRVFPMLMGLFTAVSLLWQELSACGRPVILHHPPCYTKRAMTFADALFAVRRAIWENDLVEHSRRGGCLSLLRPPLRETLLMQLSAAA